MCYAGEFNMLYESFTIYETRQKLHDLKKTEPMFWDQLTQKATVEVDIPANESITEDEDVIDPLFEDDSDLSCDMIVAKVLESQLAGTKSTTFGDIVSTAAAELLDANEMASGDGEGKDNMSVAELGLVLLRFGPEPKFKPELSWTGPEVQFKVQTLPEPNLGSGSGFKGV